MSTSTLATAVTVQRPLVGAGRVGGIGGIVFAVAVIAQNALRAGFPANDADASRIIAYYAGHRTASLVLAVLFPIGAIGLAAFIGAVLSTVTNGAGRAAGLAGAFGAAGIIGTYTMLLATDLAIAGYVHRGQAEAGTVGGLWVLHNSIFGVLLASIGITLAGLTAAASAAGSIANWWRALGLIGGILLAVAAATTPAIIDAGWTMFIGLIGFLIWVAFVVTTSITMIRRPEHAQGS